MAARQTMAPWLALAIALALSGPLFAAEGEEGSATDPAAEETMSGEGADEGMAADTGMGEATPVIGARVLDRNEEPIGKISNVLVNRSGRVEAVVLSTGGLLGLGSKEFQVPWDQIASAPDGKSMMVGIASEDIESEFSAFEVEPEPPGAAVDEGTESGDVTTE